MSEPPYEAFDKLMRLIDSAIEDMCEKPHHEYLIVSCLILGLLAKRNIDAEKFFAHLASVDRDARKSQKQVDTLINNLKRGDTHE
jgi:hypothetical protein|tara:strand:+ start:5773 stop:6027 length:255 start_codon:yes stop_codon:yes gene_type:complete